MVYLNVNIDLDLLVKEGVRISLHIVDIALFIVGYTNDH